MKATWSSGLFSTVAGLLLLLVPPAYAKPPTAPGYIVDAGGIEHQTHHHAPTRVPATDATNLSQSEISAALDQVFSFGPARAYQYYLLRLPEARNLKAEARAGVRGVEPGQTFLLQLYPEMHADRSLATVKLRFPPDSSCRDANLLRFVEIPEDNGICVTLDTFGRDVPIPVADAIATNFMNGFVTRLVLDRFIGKLHSAGLALKPSDLDVKFKIDRLPEELFGATW